MNVADGTVIAATHRRHRATEFKKFLAKIDHNVPAHLDVHVVCDNYGTHKHPTVKTWLTKHPRFHMHFTPTYSSWINQVERLFAEVTRDLLQRSDHRSVQALERSPRLDHRLERQPQAIHLDQNRRGDRSSTPSDDYCSELTARDTRSLRPHLLGHFDLQPRSFRPHRPDRFDLNLRGDVGKESANPHPGSAGSPSVSLQRQPKALAGEEAP